MENETTIFIGHANFTIDAYRHITFGAPAGVNQCFNTTKPVLVAQYMTGRTATTQSENYTGDAYMVLIPPVGRYPTNYVIDTSFLHDDVISYMITIFDWDAVCGHYGYTANEIGGIHTHSSNNSMGVIIYGVDFREGYAYPAGLKLTSFSGHETCNNKTCQNGGWCLELSSGFKCRCFKGFTGTQCDIADESNQFGEVNSEIYNRTSDTTDLKILNLITTSTISSSTTEQLSDLILNPTSLLSSTLSLTDFQTIRDSTMEISIRDSYGLSFPSEGDNTIESLSVTKSDWSPHVSSDTNIFDNSFTTVFKIPESEILAASELQNEPSLSQLFPGDSDSAEYSTLEISRLDLMSSAISVTEPGTLLAIPLTLTINPTPPLTTAHTDHLSLSRFETATPSLAITTSSPYQMLFPTKRCNGHTCQCSCPCSRYHNQSDTESYIENNLNLLKVDKRRVSKTFYLKHSAKNRKQSERDLGMVSVLFVIIITSVVIVFDMTSCVQNRYPQRRKFGR